MATPVVGFRLETAAKIMGIVNAIGKQGPDLKPQAVTTNPPAIGGFWAEITGPFVTATGYPWKRLKPKVDGTGMMDCSPSVIGLRLHEVTGKTDAVAGVRVWSMPNGIDTSGVPHWVYAAGGTPPTSVMAILGTSINGNLYNGKLCTGVTMANAADFPHFTYAAENTCYLWNLYFQDSGNLIAHDVQGTVVGYSSDTPPKPIIVFSFINVGC